MIFELPKYPRTYHIAGSKGLVDPNSISFNSLPSNSLVFEEKLDGSCVSIGFLNGKIHIHHRNTLVTSSEFDLLKRFLNAIETELYCTLDERYIMYGEWLFATHTIFYKALESYFVEYDIYDRENECFLGTKERHNLLCKLPIVSVPIINVSLHCKEIELIRHSQNHLSNFSHCNQPISQSKTIKAISELRHDTTGFSEGFYIKQEINGKVTGRYKMIRESFLDKILQSGHWNKRELVENQLRDSSRAAWLTFL